MLRAVALVVIIFCIAIPVAGWWAAQRAVPPLDGVGTFTGLGAPCVVKYDERGICYVEGSSEKDVYFAQGYASAAQRFFQMDMTRRAATGELSEVFGNATLPQDKLARTIGFNRIAKEEYKRLSAKAKHNLESYCRGVNAYLDKEAGRLGLEFTVLQYTPRAWLATDSLALLKYEQYGLDKSWELDDLRGRVLTRAGDKFASFIFNQPLKQVVVSQAPTKKNPIASLFSTDRDAPLWGSNAWAIGGGLTDTKGALLACDKHSEMSSPNHWQVCSLATGTLHVAGSTIAGVPGILIGRNEKIAWGCASLKADTQDLYLEQFSPQFPGKYKTPQGWSNAEELSEDIPVRFANPIIYKVLKTKHGPCLLKNADSGIALFWTGADPTGEPAFETMMKIEAAQNWSEFNNALSKYTGPSMSFVYADVTGNVGSHAAGSIPLRTENQGTVMLSGYSGEYEWDKRASFDQLPHEFNPAAGFVVANNPATAGAFTFNNPYRPLRIQSALSTYKKDGEHAGLPDMAILQGDQAAPLATLIRTELRAAAAKEQINDKFQLSALSLLEHWDGSLKGDSAAASVYESFVHTLAKRVLEPRLGTVMTLEYLERWPRWSVLVEQVLRTRGKDCLPPEERTYENFLLTTFANSIKNIRVELKTDEPKQWAWKNLHYINFHHAVVDENWLGRTFFKQIYDIGPVGLGGDQDSINACNVRPSTDPGDFTCTTGPAVRLLVDTADHDKLYETMALGESGHLLSPHRSDQLKAWLNFEPHAVAFSSDQLEKQLQHKFILSNN